jgi:hypothetical protein
MLYVHLTRYVRSFVGSVVYVGTDASFLCSKGLFIDNSHVFTLQLSIIVGCAVVSMAAAAAPPMIRQATLEREEQVMSSLLAHVSAAGSSGSDGDDDALALIASMAAGYTSTSSMTTSSVSESSTSVPASAPVTVLAISSSPPLPLSSPVSSASSITYFRSELKETTNDAGNPLTSICTILCNNNSDMFMTHSSVTLILKLDNEQQTGEKIVNDWLIGRRLGAGGFASVRIATHITSGHVAAMKRMSKSKLRQV